MSELIVGAGTGTEQIERFEDVKLGQWYWVKMKDRDGNLFEALRCVVGYGSNYIKFDCPNYNTTRIHLTEFFDLCRIEPNYSQVIEGYIAEHRTAIQSQLKRINDRMNELRLCSPEPGKESRALSVVSNSLGVTEYRGSLESLRDKVIPKAKERIERHSKAIESWLTSRMLGAEAELKFCDQAIGKVKERIFEFSLYAGLSESVKKIRKGLPASVDEKISVMQRTCYMDEECIAGYSVGGICCEKIEDFDKWLIVPENFNRLLPFPKCIVAFQVRRDAKERHGDGTLFTAFVNMRLRECDKLTFLYLRNGEQLYRISSNHEFGAHLFPDRDEFDLSEPLMAKSKYCDWREIEFITKREFDELARQENERPKKSRQWKREAVKKFVAENGRKPTKDELAWQIIHRDPYKNPINLRYEPFDTTSVYYDDMVESIGADIKSYNKVTLLIQGLIDRSTVFHPCPEVKMWDIKSVEQNIKLIYDGDMTLSNGEKPSVEQYLADRVCHIKRGSLVVGHAMIWTKLAQQNRSYERWGGNYDSTYEGDGPSDVARVSSVKDGKATIAWRQRSSRFYGKMTTKRMKIDVNKLLDVSAYRPGDFKKFFDDHRTRKEYLHWAHMLLVAEEWHAGNKRLKKEFEECRVG